MTNHRVKTVITMVIVFIGCKYYVIPCLSSDIH